MLKIKLCLIYAFALLVSCNKYCKICSNHTMCKYRVSGPHDRCVGSKYHLTDNDVTEILDRINERRNYIAMGYFRSLPQAANMRKINWSSELSEIAQRWANQCDQSIKPNKEDDCRDLDGTKVGQNIATIVGVSNGVKMKNFIDIWFMESLAYNGNVAYYNSSEIGKCHYFTQLIWATTCNVGCGRAVFYVQLLQQQVTSLADTQSTADERYARAKADNAVLQARVHMLDEQIREIECRCEERIAEEQKRGRDAISRIERDRDTQLSALNDRLSAAEAEASDLKQEVGRLRGVAETLRANAEISSRSAREAQDAASELAAQLSSAREAERRERETAEATKALLVAAQQELRALKATPPPLPDPRLDELQQELTLLRTQNKSLTEAQEELQAQILTRGVEEGRSLLDGVSGPLVATNSLAHELSQMSDHELIGSEQSDSIELEKLQKALKEQQEVNVQLRDYIDGILLSIVENYPQLLEVKCQKPDIKS